TQIEIIEHRNNWTVNCKNFAKYFESIVSFLIFYVEYELPMLILQRWTTPTDLK
ncbi:hypothetical protein L9F63_004032, partial [Diploptera punctata]